MTPLEKAIELYNKFFKTVPFLTAECHPLDDYNAAKQCALIAVDEIIEATNMSQFALSNGRKYIPAKIVKHPYWQEVKQEIEKL